jgi:hypothetical protein
MFHSDGKIDDAVEMLFELGMNGITLMHPPGIDHRDYKMRYGDRLTLFGNLQLMWVQCALAIAGRCGRANHHLL